MLNTYATMLNTNHADGTITMLDLHTNTNMNITPTNKLQQTGTVITTDGGDVGDIKSKSKLRVVAEKADYD